MTYSEAAPIFNAVFGVPPLPPILMGPGFFLGAMTIKLKLNRNSVKLECRSDARIN